MDLVEVDLKKRPQWKGQFHRSCAASSCDLRRFFIFFMALKRAAWTEPGGGRCGQLAACFAMEREEEVRYDLPHGSSVTKSL